jgi:hypothetical protein
MQENSKHITFEKGIERFVVRWVFAALVVVFVVIGALAQMPVVECPAHHVTAHFTGRVQKDGEGRTVSCEYTHPGHTFWIPCQ